MQMYVVGEEACWTCRTRSYLAMLTARANRSFMPEPSYPDPAAGGDRIRALEDDRFNQRKIGGSDGLEGMREISTAWQEDRTVAYLARKSWSDPAARTFFLVVTGAIAVGIAILLVQ